MNKIILTGYSGNLYKKMSQMTFPRIESYAKRYNADCKLIKFKNGNRPISWQKIPIIKKYLKKYDIVLWIDIDVVIIYEEENIFDNVENNKIQCIVNHHILDYLVPNAGVWILTKKMLPYLEIMWDNDKFLNHGWWEQAALMELMGFVVSDDESPRLYCKTDLFNKTKWLDQKWNHHPDDSQKTEYPNFIHVTMYEDRLKKIIEIINNY
jgi:hypothetical protein